MISVLLRFVYYAVTHLNWSWTASIQQAGNIFYLRPANVNKMARLHLESPAGVLLPPELPRKVYGRGSAKFKANDVDEKFKVIKEEHLKAILNFVRERNQSMSGMCTVRAIQAHLFQKYGKVFKYTTIRYGLVVRLGLKYRTTSKTRLVFTPQRIALADEFCVKICKALDEEAAGTSVLVYMDETFCHQHHMPSKAWQEDDDADGAVRCDRVRSRGKMFIILHACTKDGLLFKRKRNGERPEPGEWDSGTILNCEMIYQSKKAQGDYHDNMNGTMFLRWLQQRLIPTFKAVYGDRKLILVLDNAPYHHVRPEDCFFASQENKTSIQAKLVELHKRTIKVLPYAGDEAQIDPPLNEPGTPWASYEQWVIVEKTTGLAYLIDGMSDQGFGEVIVYTRITKKRLGAVESTLIDDFRRLLDDDFILVGRGASAIRYVRSILQGNKVPRNMRTRGDNMRSRCRRFTVSSRDVVFTYRTEDIHLTYNGAGEKGTGGPKLEWLRPAVDKYIEDHHPHLHQSKVMRVFARLGYELIWTVPYWSKSQPAELAWAYDKNYVAFEYFPGRSMSQLRQHIKQGFYGGPKRDGGQHGPIDSCLARKFITHTHTYINEYIEGSDNLSNTGIRCVLR